MVYIYIYIYNSCKDHSSGNVGSIYSHIKDSLMKPHGTSTVDAADKGHVTAVMDSQAYIYY